jgi:hypothetical protein
MYYNRIKENNKGEIMKHNEKCLVGGVCNCTLENNNKGETIMETPTKRHMALFIASELFNARVSITNWKVKLLLLHSRKDLEWFYELALKAQEAKAIIHEKWEKNLQTFTPAVFEEIGAPGNWTK